MGSFEYVNNGTPIVPLRGYPRHEMQFFQACTRLTAKLAALEPHTRISDDEADLTVQQAAQTEQNNLMADFERLATKYRSLGVDTSHLHDEAFDQYNRWSKTAEAGTLPTARYIGNIAFDNVVQFMPPEKYQPSPAARQAVVLDDYASSGALR